MGRNILRVCVFALVLGVAMPAGAVRVFGVYDCGHWRNNAYRDLAQTWVMGYMSGLNAAYAPRSGTDPLEKLNSSEQVIAWMDNYCSANPLSSVSDGAYLLYYTLTNKK